MVLPCCVVMPLGRCPVGIVAGRKIRASAEVESKWSQNRLFVAAEVKRPKTKGPGRYCFQSLY
jgi:hypothetical protein